MVTDVARVCCSRRPRRAAALALAALQLAAAWTARADCLSSGYSLDGEYVFRLVADPTDVDVVFALREAPSNDGLPVLFKSCDAGQSWSPTALTTKFHNGLRDIAIDPTDSDSVIAYDSGHGLFRSNDGGITWAVEPAPGSGYVLFGADGTAYAWTTGTAGYLLRLGPNESSWQSFGPPPGTPQVMRPHPVDGNQLHTGAAYSIDGGISWQTLESIGPADIRYSRSDPIRMIRAAFPVDLSADGGLTWQEPVFEEFSPFASGTLAGRFVAFDNEDPSVLWVALNHCGLWRSANAGFSWWVGDNGITGSASSSCRINFIGRPQPADIVTLELSPVDANRMYASTDAGVFVSSDRGNSWQAANGIAAADRPAPPPGPYSGSADLALAFIGAPGQFDPPTTVRFSARVSNLGPDPALESSFSWGDSRVVSTSVGECDYLRCYFGTLAPGAAVDLTIEFEILGGGIGAPCNGDVYTVSASVSALTEDPNSANNQASASMTRTGNAPLISSCPGEGLSGGGAIDFTLLPFLVLLLAVKRLAARYRRRQA